MEEAPTPYPDLNRVLGYLVKRIQVILRAHFVGAYLQGSFAVGDFDLNSDADFIIVTTDALTNAEVQALQVMHEGVYTLASAWAQHLEGSYFPHHILRQPPQGNRLLWYLDHGSRSLVQSDHCNTLLVRWVVRAWGRTLAGPAPATLVDPIPVSALRREILATLQGWGQDILAHPGPYQNRFYQTYIVLNYCRMLHDLHNGYPGSKRGGAEWAKATLDPSWIGLIDRAWDGRPNPALSVRRPADAADFQATLEFVRYIINESYRAVQNYHLE